MRPLATGLALLLAAVLALPAAMALADPVGTYRVEGKNPDSGRSYSGTVTVSRTGDTYAVVWEIGNTRYAGTGLGAQIKGSRFVVGPADRNDTAITIGYVSGRTFGMAMYFLKEDGRWEGVWTYGGSEQVAPEVWHPR